MVEAHSKSCRLVVDFPNWDYVSNGEMDALQLRRALFRARVRLGEKKSLLPLSNEAFDCLGDANLLVAQNFLLEMMV